LRQLNKQTIFIFLLVLSVTVYFFNKRNVCKALSNDKPASEAPTFVKDEILVKFKKEISNETINEINKLHGATIKDRKLIGGFKRLKFSNNAKSTRKLIEEYRTLDEVEFAEPNYIVKATATPNDDYFNNLWGLNNLRQAKGASGADIDATDAWDIQTDSSSIISAVIDTGVDYNHEDLTQNMWININEIADNGIDDDKNGFVDDVYGWDFINNDNDPFDDNSHGTHVAGTISAEGNNSIGVSGVCWSGKIMALKFLDANGSGNNADAIKAIDYAIKMGARVLNNSWGGSGFSQALGAAISKANKTGALFIVAAGDNGTNNDAVPNYPSSYNIRNIISVAATDNNDNLASFSNYGVLSVHLASPGVNIYSTNPGNRYGYKNGTSMAVPYVSGAVALIMEIFSDETPFEIKSRILNSVDLIQTLEGKVATGERVNINNAILGITVPPNPKLTIIYEDNMEEGTNGWVVSGPTSLWNQSSHHANSPFTSWYYGNDLFFNYDTSTATTGSLISPDIDLTNVTGSTLVFSHFLETEESSSYDKAIVRISADGGVTYSDVFTRLTTNGSFMQETINISTYDDNIINIQFFFDSVDGFLNNFEGWYVDDVKIKGIPNQEPPLANAGEDQEVKDIDGDGFERVTLNGSESLDPNGLISLYEWKEDDLVLDTGSLVIVDFSLGTHTVSLTVTDSDGLSNRNDVLITVNAFVSPVTIASQDQAVNDMKIVLVNETSKAPFVSNTNVDQTANNTDGNEIKSIILNGAESFVPEDTRISYE